MKAGPVRAGILAAALVLGGTAGPALPEEAGLPAEARQVLERSAALKSYRADLTLDAREEDGSLFRLEGKLLYESPTRRRLEIRESGVEGVQLLINDGKVEWQHYPQAGIVYRVTELPPTPGPHRPFAETQPGTVHFVGRGGTRQDPTLRFEAEPLPASVEGSPVPVEKIRVDVGEKDGLVREMALLDAQDGAILTQRFSNIEVNVPTSDEDFRFSPPQGVAVVDIPPRQAQQPSE